MNRILATLVASVLPFINLAYANTGVDGYTYETKATNITEARVKIVRFQSYKELTEYIKANYNKEISSLIAGYTVALQGTNGEAFCIIYIVDPSILYRPEYIGHELVHCIDGNFHR